MPRNRALDLATAQTKAQEYARQWLSTNRVLPEGVEANEEQFAAIMQTFLRGLTQAWAAGYMEGK